MDGRTYRQIDGSADRQMDGWTGRWMDRQMDVQVYGWTDGPKSIYPALLKEGIFIF